MIVFGWLVTLFLVFAMAKGFIPSHLHDIICILLAIFWAVGFFWTCVTDPAKG